MQKKEIKNSFADNLKEKLCKLFLHCMFNSPDFVGREIEKHLEMQTNSVILRYERNRTNENGDEISKYYTLFVYDVEFVLRFDKRLEEPAEINVPKVVKKPKKWWQIEAKDTVVIEKKKVSETPTIYWVLNSIS